MGRQKVERRVRLDRAGLEATSADHREIGREYAKQKSIKLRTHSLSEAANN
jgi:hypothetical protein